MSKNEPVTSCRALRMRDILADAENYLDAGYVLYSRICDAIRNHDKLIVDMDGVSMLPPVFLNVSLGHVIDDYGQETLKSAVGFRRITKLQAERIKDYLVRYE